MRSVLCGVSRRLPSLRTCLGDARWRARCARRAGHGDAAAHAWYRRGAAALRRAAGRHRHFGAMLDLFEPSVAVPRLRTLCRTRHRRRRLQPSACATRLACPLADAPGGFVPADMTEKLTRHLRCMKGSSQVPRRCMALSGTVGVRVGCTIYENRPTPCRAFPSYLEDCTPNPNATNFARPLACRPCRCGACPGRLRRS